MELDLIAGLHLFLFSSSKYLLSDVLSFGRRPQSQEKMKIDRNSKTFLKKVGQRVRALRRKKGWTLEQTEKHGFPSWRHLQKVEAGKNVTLVTLHRVARLLGVDPAELVQGL